MKNLILFLFCVLSSFNLLSQDIGITGSFSPNPTPVGGTSTLTVQFINSEPFMTYDIGEVYVQISFPSNYAPTGAPTGNFTSYFNLVDQGGGLWLGYNTVVIPTLLDLLPLGGQLVLNWQVTGISVTSGALTNLETNFDSLDDGTDGDNLYTTGLTVTAPLPIKLVSFEGRSTSCDQINLAWQTVSERNNDYIEIQRSSNGIDFVTLEKLSGTNRSDLNSYSYYDRNELVGGTKYYYRLKQVDFDGKFEYHKVIAVEHICASEPLALGIYPNPAIDKVNITLTGLSVPTEVNLSILNNEGSLVRTLTINSATNNEFYLNDLPAGVYHLKAEGFEETLTARFIRIQ
jgi:hypothetical protein